MAQSGGENGSGTGNGFGRRNRVRRGRGAGIIRGEGNKVWVSAQKRLSFYVNMALRMFAKHETVELHGLGEAISTAVELSQSLLVTGKCGILKIRTSMVDTSNARKPEIVIILNRSENFEALQPTKAIVKDGSAVAEVSNPNTKDSASVNVEEEEEDEGE